jgi:hypothetical protein
VKIEKCTRVISPCHQYPAHQTVHCCRHLSLNSRGNRSTRTHVAGNRSAHHNRRQSTDCHRRACTRRQSRAGGRPPEQALANAAARRVTPNTTPTRCQARRANVARTRPGKTGTATLGSASQSGHRTSDTGACFARAREGGSRGFMFADALPCLYHAQALEGAICHHHVSEP